MYSIKEIAQKIDAYIEGYKFETSTPELYEPIAYTIDQSGKRLRPALLLLSCNIFSSEVEDALAAAYAVEMFHNFTLLHDDIMDNSLLRRNMPTVHVKWGANSAILSGDAMMIEAYKLLEGVPVEVLPAVLSIFNTTARRVCEGQQLDMDFESRKDVSLDEYINMIGLKTAVLLEGAIKIGAIIGGASSEQAAQIAHYGYQIGLGFQIQDDILDLYGDPKSFGKPIGGDIIEGKKCYLLLAALECASQEQKAQIEALMADQSLEREDKIQKVRVVYDSLGIKDIATRAVEERFAAAGKILSQSGIEPSCLEELRGFVDKLKKRNK